MRVARPTFAAFMAAILSIACRPERSLSGEERQVALTLASEDVARVEEGIVERGPVVAGTLTPEIQATVRAETGGSVLEVHAEPGEAVRRGVVLARIDAAALRDQVSSARSALSSAQTTLELARREVGRLETLVDAGAVAAQELDNARRAATTAEAQRAEAEARLTSAQERVGQTIVRSPITGVVSERPVNAGDVVQPGNPLFTVVDPSSMRLEGAIPAGQMQDVQLGDAVQFEVSGYPGQRFAGTVTRINPTADPATGQVRLIVSAPNAARDLVGGLFARGRVIVERQHGYVMPSSALSAAGDGRTVTVVRDGVVQHVPVDVGLEDPLTERVLVYSGVRSGDTVLLGAARTLSPGTEVDLPAG